MSVENSMAKNVKKKLRQQIDAIWFQYRSVNRISSEYRIKTMVFGVSAAEIQEVLQSATKTQNILKKQQQLTADI